MLISLRLDGCYGNSRSTARTFCYYEIKNPRYEKRDILTGHQVGVGSLGMTSKKRWGSNLTRSGGKIKPKNEMHWFRGYELEGDYAVIIGVRGLDISLSAFGNKLGSQSCTCSCSRKREGERGTHNSTPMGIEEPSSSGGGPCLLWAECWWGLCQWWPPAQHVT